MLNIIVKDIVNAFKLYAPYAIGTGVLILVFIYLIIKIVDRKSHGLRNFIDVYGIKLIIGYILYIYCFHVVCITFLSREPGSRDSLDLKLFSTFSNNFSNNIYPIENILLFIPLGILLPHFLKWFQRGIYCCFIGIIFSLLIELSQYAAKRGYFQIDDILTNMTGTVVGYLIWWIIYRIIHIKKYAKQ
jgi:glycopeptide antibiotics resistance protein